MIQYSNKNSISLSFFSTSANESDKGTNVDQAQVKIIFMVNASTPYGHNLKVVGNIMELGTWNIQNSIILTTSRETYPL